MSHIADYSVRSKELNDEYDAVGRSLLRIKIQDNSRYIGPCSGNTSTLVYCCLFNAACVTVQDTLFLLQAEAYEYSALNPEKAIVVIGVHMDWIDYRSKSTRRYLWVDRDGICNDIVTDDPVNFDFVHFVHFKAVNEIEIHRRLTDMLKFSGIKFVNPAGATSSICDSKYKTYESLRTADIVTPETMFFSRFSLTDHSGITKRVEQFLGRLNQLYPNKKKSFLLFIQPDVGTEARETAAIHMSADKEINIRPLIKNICERKEDTVVRLGRGNVFYAGPQSNFEPKQLIIRVIVFENMAIESLSGYACIAGPTEPDIVAISKGGKKISLDSASERLVDQNGIKRDISANLRTELHYTSRQIYQTINDDANTEYKIALLGIDFVLEIIEGKVRAIAIDLNPRPVIAHSTVTMKNEEKLGLALSYWQSL